MSSKARAAVCFLGMEDPNTSTQDPAFNALLEDGWDIKANMIVERMGRHELCLLMTKQPNTVTLLTKRNIAIGWVLLLTANLVGGIILTNITP
jgi:hypothetical protein